jgi:hypothetical protein
VHDYTLICAPLSAGGVRWYAYGRLLAAASICWAMPVNGSSAALAGSPQQARALISRPPLGNGGIPGPPCICEVRAAQFHTSQFRAAEIRSGEVSGTEVGACEIVVAEVGAGQVGEAEVGAGEISVTEGCADEIRGAEVPTGEVRLAEVRMGKVRPCEVPRPLGLPTSDRCVHDWQGLADGQGRPGQPGRRWRGAAELAR